MEEIAIKTKARIVVLDPNSDFIRLKEIDPTVWQNRKLAHWFYPRETEQSFRGLWTVVPIAVVSNHNLEEAKRPVIDWGRLDANEMAAILNIDANRDADLYWCLRLTWQVASATWEETEEEYYDFDHFREQGEAVVNFLLTGQGPSVIKDSPLAETLRVSAGSEVARRFQARVTALSQYATWRSRGDGQSDVWDLIEGDDAPRVLVVDLQSLERDEERIVIADRLLKALWHRSRQEHWESIRDYTLPDQRIPTFILIDEAHNLVPSEKENPAIEQLSAQLARIAAEGRKYGLYLIVCTQRPRKIDANVLGECDNLLLMKLTNDSDLDFARQTFGFLAPKTLVLAKKLLTGEILLFGALGISGAILHVSPRRTVQGGRGLSETYWLES